MTLPEPCKITSADIVRDGGTFILMYTDGSGDQYLVKLPVQRNEKFERIGYFEPSIRSDKTGEVFRMTWADASRLAERLSPLVFDGIGMGGELRARQAIELLSLGGRLPTGA